MSTELFYVDANGKKQDASLHAEMLNEGDPMFELGTTELLLADLALRGDVSGFAMFKEQYLDQCKRLDIKPRVDLTFK